jgi:hypothetical protein
MLTPQRQEETKVLPSAQTESVFGSAPARPADYKSLPRGLNPEAVILDTLNGSGIDALQTSYSEQDSLASQMVFVNHHSGADYTPWRLSGCMSPNTRNNRS